MIVVTAPTGQIGSALVRRLLEQDEPVRVVVRDPGRLAPDVRDQVEVVTGSHAEPAVLDQALPGADALLWLVPPDRSAPDVREHYLRYATVAADAVRRHGTGRVVGISSAGHGWTEPAGVLSAAFAMDEELAGSGAAYRALSMPFYMENLLGQLDSISGAGVFSLAAPADRPFATVATADVAEAAADLLTDRGWQGQGDVPLFGPDRLTPDQMAEVMSGELGRPVAYRSLTLEELAAGMRTAGARDRAVRDTTDVFAAHAGGIYDADWAAARLGSTDFAAWCRTVLRPQAQAHPAWR
ncbi:NAD(P)H-binding protein [Cellulomonas sp. SG140]|uniref:NAD(P)H-binding protein n=1 Tax=Cellulomonas sp. SG140 TaxID=2976536 RepID=UPI0021E8AAF6|nr:NAD(P)H-binding protein [Cellulomonas sp. SG140]